MPTQNDAGLAVELITGKEITFTTVVVCEVQPAPFAPVSVYVVFVVGDTLIDVPLRLPGCQVYVLPPLAVSVIELPKQTLGLDGLMVKEGKGL